MITAIFAITLLFSLNSQALTVLIDPGHGGEDNGAIHFDIKEADITLKLSQKILELNKLKIKQRQTQKINFITSRNKDQSLDLRDRVLKSKSENVDLILSIHANSNPDETIEGVEIYYENTLPPEQEMQRLAFWENQNWKNKSSEDKGDILSIKLDLEKNAKIYESSQIANKLKEFLQTKGISSKVKQAPFYILSESSSPALLIEIGYLSNPQEAKRLTSQKYQNNLASYLHEFLSNYSGQSTLQ